MAIKKKTTKAGPKALLMKKNVDQLKRKAKQLGVKNYSTKKKAQLVQSIMLAEARKKKKPTRKKTITSRSSAKKKTGTRRKISAGIARPNKALVKALEVMPQEQRNRAMKMYGLADRRNNRQMAQRYFYEANFEGFGLRELDEAGKLLTLYANGKLTPLANAGFVGGEIKVGFNANYGNVFLFNEDNETLMKRGNKLDLFITLPYGGEEGFIDELYDIYNELDDDDKEALDDYKSLTNQSYI